MHRHMNVTSTGIVFRKYFLMQSDLFERNCSCLLSELLWIAYSKKLCLLLFVKQEKKKKAVMKLLALTIYFTYKTYVTYVSNLLIRRFSKHKLCLPCQDPHAWILNIQLLKRRMKKAVRFSDQLRSRFRSVIHYVNLWTVLDNWSCTFPEEDPLL